MMRKPVYLKEEFQHRRKCHPKNIAIKHLFDLLFVGFITEFEMNNNMNIPTVIANIIRNNIKVGVAYFYCKGFNNPLFGVYDKNEDTVIDDNYLNKIV